MAKRRLCAIPPTKQRTRRLLPAKKLPSLIFGISVDTRPDDDTRPATTMRGESAEAPGGRDERRFRSPSPTASRNSALSGLIAPQGRYREMTARFPGPPSPIRPCQRPIEECDRRRPPVGISNYALRDRPESHHRIHHLYSAAEKALTKKLPIRKN
jgi:hypothetical protein